MCRAALPVAGFPRKEILWLDPRWTCWPQVFTLFTSAQICCSVICNNTQPMHPRGYSRHLQCKRLDRRWWKCDVSPVLGASPPTNYRCCRSKRLRWCSAHENRYFPNCHSRWNHCYGPAERVILMVNLQRSVASPDGKVEQAAAVNK